MAFIDGLFRFYYWHRYGKARVRKATRSQAAANNLAASKFYMVREDA